MNSTESRGSLENY